MIIPLADKVLVEVDKAEEASAGGIVLTSSIVDKEQAAEIKGKILAIGELAFNGYEGRQPVIGDIVYFAKYQGLYLDPKDEESKSMRLMADTDILAIIEGDDND